MCPLRFSSSRRQQQSAVTQPGQHQLANSSSPTLLLHCIELLGSETCAWLACGWHPLFTTAGTWSGSSSA